MASGLSFFERISRPAIIAHRGSSADAPENTLAAFQLAVEQGADAIELDVKLCSDGEVVVMHDASVDRTTDGRGLVKDLRLADLKRLNASAHFNHPGRRREEIPTLAEVFAAVGEKIVVNVELTNYTTPWDDLPIKAGQVVSKNALEERVLFSSFNLLALLRAAHHYPQISRALLASSGTGRFWQQMRFIIKLLGCKSFHAEIGDVNPELIQRMHSNHVYTFVYTVNDLRDLKRMSALHVDGVFTDHVLLAREILAMGEGNEIR